MGCVMTIDYNTYELTRKQKMGFLMVGYVCIALCVFLFFRSTILSACAGALVWLLIPRYEAYLAAGRRRDLRRQFKDFLVALSSSIESGRQMEEAIVEARDTMHSIYDAGAPIVVEADLMRRGILENNDTDLELLTSLARRSGCEDIQNFVQVYLSCRSSGGDLVEIISHTTNVMTEKMEINEQIEVLTAQKRLEGRIISAMPFAMLTVLNLLSPAYISVLYEGVAGRLVMLTCLVGICAGIWLMERLTDVEV